MGRFILYINFVFNFQFSTHRKELRCWWPACSCGRRRRSRCCSHCRFNIRGCFFIIGFLCTHSFKSYEKSLGFFLCYKVLQKLLWTSVVLAISFPDCFECTVAMGQPIAGLQLATSLYRNNYKIMFLLIIDKLHCYAARLTWLTKSNLFPII